jgi:hypothetical protein
LRVRILTHSERFYSGMEPKPVGDFASALAGLQARIEAARRLDVGPKVVVTDIEAQIDSR